MPISLKASAFARKLVQQDELSLLPISLKTSAFARKLVQQPTAIIRKAQLYECPAAGTLPLLLPPPQATFKH